MKYLPGQKPIMLVHGLDDLITPAKIQRLARPILLPPRQKLRSAALPRLEPVLVGAHLLEEISKQSGIALRRERAVTELSSVREQALYVDPVAGDDDNDGSARAPLKTWAEFDRRGA